MTIADLSHIQQIFSASEKEKEQEEDSLLAKEVLLMTLARASSADSNINPVEVHTVQEIIKRLTGEDVSAADVRVAAHSSLFEEAPLQRCLQKVRKQLSAKDRAMVAQSLAAVIKSDVRITYREAEFFDMVANALRVSPSELAGLVPDSP